MHFLTRRNTTSEQKIVSNFMKELDKIERDTQMVSNYERMDPEIVEHTQAGVTFRFIIYHQESKLWFGPAHKDTAMGIVLRAHMLHADDIVFDLGCNSGYHTAWFAKQVPRGHVYSFDPFPWNIAATKAQAALNGCNNVTTYSVGLGDTKRSIVTDVTGSKTFDPVVPREGYSIKIDIDTPDRFLAHNPTFLKIDIEGAEFELAKTTLLTHPSVRRGYVEMHTQFILAGGGDPAFFLDRLIEEKFDVFDSDLRSLQSFDPVVETGYYFRR